MLTIRICLTTFEDLSQYAPNMLTDLFDFMRTEIAKGTRFVIERRYSNDPPDTLRCIRNDQELTEFMKEIKPKGDS